MVWQRYKKVILAIILLLAIIGYIGVTYRTFFVYHIHRILNNNVSATERMLIDILEENPELVFETFKSILKENPKTSAVCHGIAHKLGHHAYKLYGLQNAMQYQNPMCGAGYIHGVIESHFGLFSKKLLSEDILSICTSDDEQCNHGIGHGLMVYTNNNIKESLASCDLLSNPGKSDCHDGVFMHVFDNEETGISKNIPERSLAEKLCEQFESQHMTSCYFYLPRIFTHDIEIGSKTADMCMRIHNTLSPRAHEICSYGAGISFEKYLPSHDEAMNVCATYFKGSAQQQCYKGIASYASWSESRFAK